MERKKQRKPKKTALNSNEFICKNFSNEDQKPKASLFSEVQHPQPESEASVKISMWASKGERDLEGKELPILHHQDKSLQALAEGETKSL